jgi:glycosyltransferase involved in cell wall biosynthesis
MKLSIVIPAYNEEKNLGQCLDSIFKEKEGKDFNIEIIVVNNASTDKTRQVAESFADVKVVDEVRKGIVWARRAGFLASSGELIANIDADTILTKNWLDKVFNEFAKNKKLVALSGPYIYYDLPKWKNLLVKFYYYGGMVLYFFTHYVLRAGAMIQGGNYVIKKDVLEKMGGYDTTIKFYGEDTDIARRANKLGEVKFTFNLPMMTSGRRLESEGVVKMGIRYGLNYIWTILFKKPLTKEYKDVRNIK